MELYWSLNNARSSIKSQIMTPDLKAETGSRAFLDAVIVLQDKKQYTLYSDYIMEQCPSGETQVSLLQRCKETIEVLHQQMVHLQLNNEILQAERKNLKRMIEEKDRMVKQLEQRIYLLHSTSLSLSEYNDQHSQSKLTLFNKYSNLLAENQQLRRQIDCLAERGRVQSPLQSNYVRNMDSGLFCSPVQDWGQISVRDMLASDKKILVYLVSQKDRQISHLARQNRGLKKERNKLTDICQRLAKKTDYRNIPNSFRGSMLEDSAQYGLRLPESQMAIRKQYEYGPAQKKRSLSKKSSSSKLSGSLSKNRLTRRTEAQTIKTPRRFLQEQQRKRSREVYYSPQEMYYMQK